MVDQDSFFEIGRRWGRPIITGLARLNGWPVAIIASDPHHYAGAWTADASQKFMRHVDLAETFHLPVVHLVDIPGFLVGPEAEQTATIRYGARAMTALIRATIPWCSVLVRKVYGVAGSAHQNAARYNLRYTWPSAEWGSLPVEGGLEAAYRGEIEAARRPGRQARRNRRAHQPAALARSAPRRHSSPRKSSIRATRGGCSATSPISRRRCGGRDTCGRAFGRRPE